VTDDLKLSRRTVLKTAGVASVAAGCAPKPLSKLYPFLTPPEDIIPGTPVFYRTVCRECPAGCGVTAKSREGRAIKLEGNPEDPIGRGKLCARGQAGIQGLYAPDRLRGPQHRQGGTWTPLSWDEAQKELVAAISAAGQKGGDAIRLITRSEPGSVGALQKAFLRSIGVDPKNRLVLEPLDLPSLRSAGRLLFDREETPAFDLAVARSVVAFGADFLETWLSPVELTRGFAQGRGQVGPLRTRLTWVGPRRSATGASADVWLHARAGTEATLAFGLLRWLLDPQNAVEALPAEAGFLRGLVAEFDEKTVADRTGVAGEALSTLGRELSERRPSAVLGPGPSSAGTDATELATAVQLVNYVLGNLGKTVLYGLDPRVDPPSTPAELGTLIEDMSAGKVDLLFVHHADPLGTMPRALGFESAIEKARMVVSFGLRMDATTAKAHLVLPDHHPLESFGDVAPRKGVVALCQPVMNPLWNTRPASQVLLDTATALPNAAAHFPFHDFYEYTQTRAETYAMVEYGAVGDLVEHQRIALGRGGYFSNAKPEPVVLRQDLGPFHPRVKPAPGSLTLAPFPTTLRWDGRSAHHAWLREVPDVMSTISWTTWAEVSPGTAARLGVVSGDEIELSTSAGSATVPASIQPAIGDDVVALPLGTSETLALVPKALDPVSGGLAWLGAAVSVRRTGVHRDLPRIEGEDAPQAGELLKKVTAAQPEVPKPQLGAVITPPPEHPVHRWAMAIDLDKCTGCQACIVACYAENNVPVMGPEFTATGRNMAWLRTERFYDFTADTAVDFLPMLCQQCSSAPCETVCPVYATYHTSEGLNAQVYNRCVGTRYCSNNCPYKVREFNYKDPEFPAPLNLQLNPDVSVRARGVMEKCTFCVQRIRFAENRAQSESRRIVDGEFAPACVQTCPASVFTFGDADDPRSKVQAAQKDSRGFRVLEELNTQPAVTYLARVADRPGGQGEEP
jgi:anaerobic selenocysteine-containing dehydrogenase/Fe-S-cluster-containing dehydrogenase component